MTCKDCVHNVICSADAYFKEREGAEAACVHFKPKSRYIELPCAVGDTVWWLTTANWEQTKWKIVEVKVSMLQQKADKSWKIRLTHMSSVFDITTDELGKTVFLTKEEAEKALAERSEGIK